MPFSTTLPTTAYTVSLWENVSSFTNVANPTLFSTRTDGDNTFDIQLTSTGGLHADYGRRQRQLDKYLRQLDWEPDNSEHLEHGHLHGQ